MRHSNGNIIYRNSSKQWMLTITNEDVYSTGCLYQYSNDIKDCNMDSRYNSSGAYINGYAGQWSLGL